MSANPLTADASASSGRSAPAAARIRQGGCSLATGLVAGVVLTMMFLAPNAGAVPGAATCGWGARVAPAERVEPGLRPAPVGPVDKN